MSSRMRVQSGMAALGIAVAVVGCSRNRAEVGPGPVANDPAHHDEASPQQQHEARHEAPSEVDRSCQADTDCVPAPSCCPMPCNANVINKRSLAAARDAVKRTCDTPPDACPVAGSCSEHAYLCVGATCQLVYGDDPAYRPRGSPPPVASAEADSRYYVTEGAPPPRACRADEDCTGNTLTDGCCVTEPTPQPQSTAYARWLQSLRLTDHCSDVKCPPPPVPTQPADCTFDVHCVHGRCENTCP